MNLMTKRVSIEMKPFCTFLSYAYVPNFSGWLGSSREVLHIRHSLDNIDNYFVTNAINIMKMKCIML